MEKKYARAILDLVSRGATPVQAVKAVFELLESRGRGGLMRKIRYATAIEGQKIARRGRATLIVAKADDAKSAKTQSAKYVKDIAEVSVEADERIIGGWRLERDGSVVDQTYKTALLDIYKRITK